ERNALERTSLADCCTERIVAREHETTQLGCTRATENRADGLLMDVAQYEVAPSVDDAADHITVGMHARVLECVSTPEAFHVVHIVRSQRSYLADRCIKVRFRMTIWPA